ncbi:MAG: phosphoribosyl-ATP diphosphatase [Burkholderiales bacterium]
MNVLDRIAQTLESRKGADPSRSYAAKLFNQGEDAILRKIGEEAIETLLASKADDRLIAEMADLWFHCLVLLSYRGIKLQAVLAELERREGVSGLDEKAARKQRE